MARVAFYTFGIMHEPWGHPRVSGFERRIPLVFHVSEESQGFIGSFQTATDKDYGNWCFPAFVDPGLEQHVADTLSLWDSLESVVAFAYGGLHAEALQHRHDWFTKGDWPTYAVWWVGDDHIPTWKEACERLEHLHTHGSMPYCFNVRQAFDADGQPVKVDHARVLAVRKPVPEAAPV